MTITFGNTQISLEDGNTAAAPQASTPQAPAPAKKKGHGKLLLLAGLGVAGYIAAGGATGIQGMVNGASAAGKTIDTIGNISKDYAQASPIAKAGVKAIGMARGAMTGRDAALQGYGKLMQKTAGAASLFME